MITTEMKEYVYEQHRQGLNDKQIAERLGMSVGDFVSMMACDEKPVRYEYVDEKKPEKKEKPITKPVSGVPSTTEKIPEKKRAEKPKKDSDKKSFEKSEKAEKTEVKETKDENKTAGFGTAEPDTRYEYHGWMED